MQNGIYITPFYDIACPGSIEGGHVGYSLWIVTAKGPDAGSLLISRNGLGLYHEFGEHIGGEARVEIAAGTIAPKELGAIIVYRGIAALCPYAECPVVVVALETECEVEIAGRRYVIPGSAT